MGGGGEGFRVGREGCEWKICFKIEEKVRVYKIVELSGNKIHV